MRRRGKSACRWSCRSFAPLHVDVERATFRQAGIVVASHNLLAAGGHRVVHFQVDRKKSAHPVAHAQYSGHTGDRLDGGFERAPLERLTEGKVGVIEEALRVRRAERIYDPALDLAAKGVGRGAYVEQDIERKILRVERIRFVARHPIAVEQADQLASLVDGHLFGAARIGSSENREPAPGPSKCRARLLHPRQRLGGRLVVCRNNGAELLRAKCLRRKTPYRLERFGIGAAAGGKRIGYREQARRRRRTYLRNRVGCDIAGRAAAHPIDHLELIAVFRRFTKRAVAKSDRIATVPVILILNRVVRVPNDRAVARRVERVGKIELAGVEQAAKPVPDLGLARSGLLQKDFRQRSGAIRYIAVRARRLQPCDRSIRQSVEMYRRRSAGSAVVLRRPRPRSYDRPRNRCGRRRRSTDHEWLGGDRRAMRGGDQGGGGQGLR